VSRCGHQHLVHPAQAAAVGHERGIPAPHEVGADVVGFGVEAGEVASQGKGAVAEIEAQVERLTVHLGERSASVPRP
jgi:hypothetical protein